MCNPIRGNRLDVLIDTAEHRRLLVAMRRINADFRVDAALGWRRASGLEPPRWWEAVFIAGAILGAGAAGAVMFVHLGRTI